MDAIKIFGDHIYRLAGKNPEKTRRHLAFIYNISGLLCKYFPNKKLLPSRQYLQWVTTDTVMKALTKGEGSSIVNIYLPCELLHAMGINLMFPESYACYLAAAGSTRFFIETAEANDVPATLCSYHKSFIGFMESGVMPKPDFVINTTLACDANHLTFRRAAEYYNIPHFVIDVPSSFTEYNLEYVAGQLRGMKDFIEKNSSFRLDEEKFRHAIICSKNTLRNIREMIPLRADRSVRDEMNSFMIELMASHALLGSDRAERYTRDYLEELRAIPKGKKGLRLVWLHTLPYWQAALKELIDLNDRCEIVACDMTYDAMHVDLSEEDPYRYMAQRLLTCTMNGPATNRLEAALTLAKQLDADGIILYCPWGCKQSAGISSLAVPFFEEKGFPVLVLDGDGCDPANVSDGQTVTRTEAFLELLENKRKTNPTDTQKAASHDRI